MPNLATARYTTHVRLLHLGAAVAYAADHIDDEVPDMTNLTRELAEVIETCTEYAILLAANPT